MTRMLMYPDGDPFPSLAGPIITREQLRLEELEHPERFGPEYGGVFATALNAYLDPKHVARAFEPWNDCPLAMRTHGQNSVEYFAHADPGRSGANFALVIAHAMSDDEHDPHVIVDHIRVWQPRDFDGEINYVTVENELFEYIKDFQLRQLTFDQWNSAGTIDHLRARVRDAGFWWYTEVSERTATAASNWSEAENFKTSLFKNLVHSPYLELAEQELISLQWDGHQKVHPPVSGPCTTSDIADCFFALTYVILEGRFDPHKALSELAVRGAFPHGLPQSPSEQAIADQFSAANGRTTWHAARRGYPRDRHPGRGYGHQ